MTVTMTLTERREKKIAQLRARIQKEQALLNHAERKRRNGRLVSLGIMFEKNIINLSQEDILMWKGFAEQLDKRNASRALEAFAIVEHNTLPNTPENLAALDDLKNLRGEKYSTVKEAMAAFNA